MKSSTFFLFLCLRLAMSHNLKPEIIPAILDELKMNWPIIQNKLIEANDFTKIIKHLSHNGYRISFSLNQTFQPYQSYLIFSNLRNFKWNLPTYTPILVMSRIQNELELKSS